jgi:hypothetical protein
MEVLVQRLLYQALQLPMQAVVEVVFMPHQDKLLVLEVLVAVVLVEEQQEQLLEHLEQQTRVAVAVAVLVAEEMVAMVALAL